MFFEETFGVEFMNYIFTQDETLLFPFELNKD